MIGVHNVFYDVIIKKDDVLWDSGNYVLKVLDRSTGYYSPLSHLSAKYISNTY